MSVVLDTYFLCIANIMELHAIAFVNFSHSRKLMLMLQITICCSLALCLRFQFQLKTLQVKCGKYCTQMAHLKSTYFEYGSHEGDTLNRRKDAWKKKGFSLRWNSLNYFNFSFLLVAVDDCFHHFIVDQLFDLGLEFLLASLQKNDE